MATPADVRRLALALPGALAVEDHGGVWFNVGRRTFIVFGFPHARWIFKLPKPRQELLFEARPDVFQPYRAGAMVWSYVAIEALGEAELADYIRDAWSMVAPRGRARPAVPDR